MASTTHDSAGIAMAIIAVCLLYLWTYIVIYVSFRLISAISVKLAKRNAMKTRGITDKKEAKEKAIGAESVKYLLPYL